MKTAVATSGKPLDGKPHRIQIRPRIGDADLKVKAKTIKRMLKKGKMVRVTVQFRGREMDHIQIGLEKLKTLYGLVGEEFGSMSSPPTEKGRELFLVMRPKS